MEELDLDINKLSEDTLKRLQMGVMSGLCQHGQVFAHRIKDIVNKNHFSNDKSKFYFDLILQIVDGGFEVDDIQLEQFALWQYKEFFHEHKKELLAGLHKIRDNQISLANAFGYAQTLARRYYKNKVTDGLFGLAKQLKELPDNTPSEETETALLDFVKTCASGNTSDDKMEPLGIDIVEYVEELINSEESQPGLDIGFPLLEEMVGGVLPGTVHVISSRMKMGKSALLLNIALNAARLGTPVLYLDMEMQRKQVQRRVLANMSGVELNWIKWKTFKTRPEQVKSLQTAAETVSKLPLMWRKCAGMKVDKYLSFIRRWIIQHVGFDADGLAKPCLVVIDYIKKTGGNDARNEKDWEILGETANKIKDFAAETGVAIFSAVQLNRQATQPGQRGQDTNIAGSDIIAREVDTVIEYSKKTDGEVDTDNADLGHFGGNRVFVQSAVREAEPWDKDDYISVEFNGAEMRYIEHGRRSQFMKKKEPKQKRTRQVQSDEVPV